MDGPIGRAVKFGGVNNKGYVEIAQNDSLRLNNEVTVSYWLRMDSHYGEFNDDNNFVAKGNHAVFVKGNEGSMSSYIYTNSGTADLWYQKTPAKRISATNPFTVGIWVHVAFTISPTTLKGYINGQVVSNTNLTTPVNLTSSNTGAMYIGWMNSSWYALNGSVDDFRMYNKALSDSEISTLYHLAD